jgi:hypothetical protein
MHTSQSEGHLFLGCEPGQRGLKLPCFFQERQTVRNRKRGKILKVDKVCLVINLLRPTFRIRFDGFDST